MNRQNRRRLQGKQQYLNELQIKLLEYTKKHFAIAEVLVERLSKLTGKSIDRVRRDAINEALQSGDLLSYFKRELDIWSEDHVIVSGEIIGTSGDSG